MEWLQFLEFDIAVFAPTCYFGGDTLRALYVPRVCTPLVIVGKYAFLGLLAQFGHCIAPIIPLLKFDACFNAVGVVINALFVGVVKSVFEVFYCRENPSYNTPDELKAPLTRTKYEGYLCSSDGNDDLLQVLPFTLLFAVLYIVTALAVYSYGLWLAPKMWHIDSSFRGRFRFLLGRWNAQWWYWGGLVMLRNLLLPIITACTVGGLWQLMCFICIVGTLCVLQLWCQPWREPIGNFLDAGMSLALIGMNIFGIGMLRKPAAADADIVALVALISFVISMSLIVLFVTIELLPVKFSFSANIDLDSLAGDVIKVFHGLRNEDGQVTDMMVKEFVSQLSQQDGRRLCSLVNKLRWQFAGSTDVPSFRKGILPPTILTSVARGEDEKNEKLEREEGDETTV